MHKRITAYLLLILATFLWGIGGPIIKYAFNFVTPIEFLFWRLLIASVVTLPIFLWYLKKYPIHKNQLSKLLLLGFLGTPINLLLVFIGLKYTSVVESAMIGSLNPMLVAIGGAIFLNETLTRKKQIGIVLAIAGTIVAISNPILDHDFLHRETLYGNILVLLSGISWLIFVILSKKWESPEIKPFHVVSISFFLGLIFFYIIYSLQTLSFTHPIPVYAGLWGIVYMAIFSSLIAFTAYEVALTKIQASEADLFNYLGSVWAIPLAIFWLGEKFDPALIVSAVLIALGIIIAEYKHGLMNNLRGHHHSHKR